VLKRK